MTKALAKLLQNSYYFSTAASALISLIKVHFKYFFKPSYTEPAMDEFSLFIPRVETICSSFQWIPQTWRIRRQGAADDTNSAPFCFLTPCTGATVKKKNNNKKKYKLISGKNHSHFEIDIKFS